MRYVIYNPLACNGKGEEIKDRFLNEIDDKNNISLINGLEVKPIEFKKILKDV